jgi:hypothetical protein
VEGVGPKINGSNPQFFTLHTNSQNPIIESMVKYTF